MNHTPNYNLSQWAKSDRVLMDDFNADNAKIDAALAGISQTLARRGNCQFVMGSYSGSGEKGEYHPNSLSFSKKPMVLLVSEPSHIMIAVRNGPGFVLVGGSSRFVNFTWTDRAVSWYSRDELPNYQMNASGMSYSYLALVEA